MRMLFDTPTFRHVIPRIVDTIKIRNPITPEKNKIIVVRNNNIAMEILE